MKVYVYVEGEADRLALDALWQEWRDRLRGQRHGIQIIPLDDKTRFFRKLGPRAAEKLVANRDDIVVALPDLYPNRPYESSDNRHDSLEQLADRLRMLVSQALIRNHYVAAGSAEGYLGRFCPTALKHDLEMLLLAAHQELREVLGTRDALGGWRKPVEDQNQDTPPKRVVEELFRTKSRRRHTYRDTVDAPAVLRRVTDLHGLLYGASGRLNCPVFKQMLDWVGDKTGVPAYGPPATRPGERG